MKYHGNMDLASLEKFIMEKLGVEVADENRNIAAKEPATPVVKLNKRKFIQEKLGETDELAKKFEADSKDSTEAQGVQENKVRGLPAFPYFR